MTIMQYGGKSKMCIATKLAGELDSLLLNLDFEHKKFKDLRSNIDRKLNQFYENVRNAGNFNIVQGYHLTKELQLILQERRIIKNELEKINGMYLKLQALGISETVNEIQDRIKRYDNRYGDDDNWYDNFRFNELPKF